jgi:hypothetical protein
MKVILYLGNYPLLIEKSLKYSKVVIELSHVTCQGIESWLRVVLELLHLESYKMKIIEKWMNFSSVKMKSIEYWGNLIPKLRKKSSKWSLRKMNRAVFVMKS